MESLTAEEIFDRLLDRYTATEIVEVLELDANELGELGLIKWIDDNMDVVVGILSDEGLYDV